MKLSIYLGAALLAITSTVYAENAKIKPGISQHVKSTPGKNISSVYNSDWLHIKVFFQREIYNLYITPKAKIKNILQYIARKADYPLEHLTLSISSLEETDNGTRMHKVTRKTHVLSNTELNSTAEDFNRTVFTVNLKIKSGDDSSSDTEEGSEG